MVYNLVMHERGYFMAYIDLTNQRFGKLTVIKKGNGRYTSGGNYKITWICQCDCGNTTEVDGEKLRRGHTTSCGCFKKDNKGSHFEDLTGQKFNRLTVIRFIPESERKIRQYNWLCKCDCGNEVKASAYKLKQGLQQSCGCLKEEYKGFIGTVNRKYKHSNKRLYNVYLAMIDRCYNKSCKRYSSYGARGITVEECWLGEYGYDVFAEWAFKAGYNPKAKFGECTLDRIDVNKNYSPDNCRWITNKQQQNNRRDCHWIEYKGEKHTIAEWAEILNKPYGTLYNGIVTSGKSIEYYMGD